MQSPYDFHFYVRQDILTVFYYLRAESLISVAKTPTSLPSVYGDRDRFALAGNSSDYQPSPVVKINGVDVEEWINEFAAFNPWSQDPDANYNAVFFNPASHGFTTKDGNYFRTGGGLQPQASETVLTFQNGTRRNIDTYAQTFQVSSIGYNIGSVGNTA